MEKRKLNLSAPLLSARRYSSPLKSGEMAVENQPPIRQHPRAPLLEPHWNFDDPLKPAAGGGGIPFQWELSPGRPRDDLFRRYHSGEISKAPPPPVGRTSYFSGEVTRLTPARFSDHHHSSNSIYKPQVEAFSFNDHAHLVEKLNDSLNCDEGTDSETFSSALDLNYAVNGNAKKPSGKSSSVDTQTRDLMMNRFLQAAKAAVVETPEFAPKKLPKPANKKPPNNAPSSSSYASPYHKQSGNGSEFESEDDDQDCKNNNTASKKSGKAWGILPRFCVKNTLCLLNPIPGIKSRMHLQHTTTPSTPTAAAAASAGRFTRNARSGPLDKSGFPLFPEPQKKKFYSGLLSRDLLKNESKLTAEDRDRRHLANSQDSFFRAGLSPLRRYRSGNPSPHRNDLPKSSFSGPLNESASAENSNSNSNASNKIASSRKLFNALNNVSRNHTYVGGGGGGDAVEKTVYIDKCSYNKNDDANPEKCPKFGQVVQDDFSFVFDAKMKGRHHHHHPHHHHGHHVDTFGSVRKPDGRAANSKQVPPDEKKPKEAAVKKKPAATTPLGPPLPNSPSESWLWKTLPAIPKPQRSSSHSQPLQKNRVPQNHRPYSQELMPRSNHRQIIRS
ncbi:hypothetical protein M569_17039 [Genlisea aurea]|uniref:Uncharacterized protein n=1 Tax=Genlisea aurea TaxID=192259 RepID=S8D500_9LAMI|nr:hypothetical protein M569_17039 [Genlisea aurea]